MTVPKMDAVLFYDTDLPADSVEVFPNSLNEDRLFSLGTYSYNVQAKARTGYLEILRLMKKEHIM